MIITLDLTKTYGQQNADIAKKDKINKINISVNLQSDSEDTSTSDSSKQVNYGPITIDQNYDNLIEIKSIESKTKFPSGREFGLSWDSPVFARFYGESDVFPTYYGVIKYKNYSISIDVTNSQYEGLKYINSIIPIISYVNGSKSQSEQNENQSFIEENNNSTDVYMPQFYSSDIENSWEQVDIVNRFDNLSADNPFYGVTKWDESASINNNEYSSNNNSVNVIDEILNLIQDGINNTNSNFSKLNDYVNPKILTWNNDNSTLKIDIQIPTSLYFFVSNNGYQWQLIDAKGLTAGINYKDFDIYKYNFTQANISFILNYNVDSEERSYYDGNRDYSASSSFLFTEGVINSDTHYVTVVNEETQESARLYDNYYDKTFADEVYEKYENGKLKLEITYPVSHLQTISGIDVVYSEEYGLCTNIGDEYFDENGNKIYVDADDTITTFTQIPEGTLCNIVKNGEVVYKDANGNPKYFLVQNSNLVYSGILVNELTLIESSEQPVSAFDEASWGEINAIGRLGELDKHFSVGEKKYVYMSNQPDDTYTNPVPIVILGFNHDALSNGNGNAGMTLGMETVLVDRYPMNDLNTNPMGWNDCYFRNTTVPQLIQTLPSDLQSVIKTVKKESLIDNTSTDYQESDDTLFLLSVAEITGADYITNNNFSVGSAEGEQYEYWKTIKDGTSATDRQKLDYNTGDGQGNLIPVPWTTRSISTSNPTSPSFMEVDSSGNLTTGGVITNNSGISYAFCVGETRIKPLDQYSWEEINNFSLNGNAENIFSIGDTKAITLSTGETVIFEIIGFKNDELADDSGNMAGISFQCRYVLNNENYMTTEMYGYWENSNIFINVLPNIYNSLPEDLKAVIKTVKYRTGTEETTTADGTTTKEAIYTSGNISLLGANNIDYTRYVDFIDGVEGTNGIYEYYSDNEKSKRVKSKIGNNTNIKWWTRTVAGIENNISNFYCIDESGNIINYAGNQNLGIVFCFSV